MSIDDTISEAARVFNVPLRALLCGSRKTRNFVAARERIVQSHPEATDRELASAMNLDRTTIICLRRRLSVKSVNCASEPLTFGPWYVQ